MKKIIWIYLKFNIYNLIENIISIKILNHLKIFSNSTNYILLYIVINVKLDEVTLFYNFILLITKNKTFVVLIINI